MKRFIAKLLVTLGVLGAAWFAATIDNLNMISFSGLILAAICFPLALFVDAEYITNQIEEGDDY